MSLFKRFACAMAICLSPLAAKAAPFTAGDIVVERLGTGAGALSGAATAVFVDEYTPAGTLVQSIALPTTGALSLTDSGSATSNGYLNLSGNGQYLTLSGYNADVGTAGVATTKNDGTAGSVNRVIGRIDGNGNVDTSTHLTSGFDGNNVRSAYSPDGTTLYASGTAKSGSTTGGVWTVPFGTSGGTQVSATTGSPVLTNVRNLEGYGNQLYVSNSTTTAGLNSGVEAVGSGFPITSGNILSNVPGLDNNSGGSNASPYGFVFAKLNPASPGFDTVYVADDGATTPALAGGIEKYSLVGGNWVLNNKIGSSADSYRGLTGVETANGFQLYATRQGTNPGIVSLLDTSGYNNNDNATPSLIVALPTNEAFRGIDFAPQAIPTPEPSSFALGGLSLLGLLLAARRRRAAQS